MIDHKKVIKDRLDKILEQADMKKLIISEYAFTFQQLGLPKEEANTVAEKVVGYVIESKNLVETEDKVKVLFTNTKVGDKNIFELIKLGLADRIVKVLAQLTPYLQGIKGKVFDYGMGSGQVTQTLKDNLHLNIEGGDVRDFRAKNVDVPFVLLSSDPGKNGKIVDVPDKYYEAAVLTNVIHHEEENENILRELNRIVAKKLVIIETIPEGHSVEEIKQDHERTFANDALWNRFFNYADIPVPGTYETPEDWIKRFESYGWKTTHSENLGYDQKTIHDIHHLLVFER